MWILTIYYPNNGSNADVDNFDNRDTTPISYRLLGSSEYTVGRKGCIIQLPQDDPSISRHHATIVVTKTPAAQLNCPTSYFPKIYIIDFSKHGTLVNGMIIPPLTKKESARSGSTIIFGRNLMGVVHFAPIVAYISRTVYPHNVEQLKLQIANMCGFVTEADNVEENIDMTNTVWTQAELREAGVSPSALLYIAEGLVPEKGLMNCLLERYCLVSPAYIPALTRVVKDTPAIPVSSLPPPGSCEAPRDEMLEQLPYRRPEPQIFEALEFSRTGAPNPSAAFRTMHLVFLESDSYNLYAEAVRRGGGVATLVTAYDVMSWYQTNAQNVLASSSMTSNLSVSPRRMTGTTAMGAAEATASAHTDNNNAPIPVADNNFPLRFLVQDCEAHGTNTFLVASDRSFIATLDLIEEGIQEGNTDRRKSNRTIISLPPPTGTVADALGLLYLKAKLPLVREANLLHALYAEDAATFVAGRTAGRSPTNKITDDVDNLHFDFVDSSIAASALHVELEEASSTGLLHAPKRHISSGNSPPYNTNNTNNSGSRRRGGNSPEGNASAASSVSTVDAVAPYNPQKNKLNNMNNASSSSAMKNSQMSQEDLSNYENSSSVPTNRSPASRRIGFDESRNVEHDHDNDDDNQNSELLQHGNNTNTNKMMLRSQSSYNQRQKIICCQPERLHTSKPISPKRDREVFTRQQQQASSIISSSSVQQQQQQQKTIPATDSLYSRWQSFYESSRTSDLERTRELSDSTVAASTAVGRRSPVLTAINASINEAGGSSNNYNQTNVVVELTRKQIQQQQHQSKQQQAARTVSNMMHSGTGGVEQQSQSDLRTQSLLRSQSPFVVSQSAIPRGGGSPRLASPPGTSYTSQTNSMNTAGASFYANTKNETRAASGDLFRNPDSAPFATKVLRSSSPASPRLLMSVSGKNVDARLLQYCNELKNHSLPEIETAVLASNTSTTTGNNLTANADLLKQRVMRYLIDIDLLISESKRFSSTQFVGRPGSPSRRASSPMRTAAQVEAQRHATDCRSRLSVLLTVLDGPADTARLQQQLSSPSSQNNNNENQQQQQRLHLRYPNEQQIEAVKSLERALSNTSNPSHQRNYYDDNVNDNNDNSGNNNNNYTTETANRMISHPRSKSPAVPNFSSSLLLKKKVRM